MDIPAEAQKNQKIAALRQGLLSAGISVPEKISYSAPEHGRDRVDLIFSDGHYGFYQKLEKSVFEIQECPQMSPELFLFFKELKKIPLPIRKGSLRLRVSPNYGAGPLRGLWLDFANTDIQLLFEEKKTLHRLMALSFVEIGQRKKKLEFDGIRFRLRDPEFHPWTRTWIQDQAYPLDSLVGSFSQTGDRANKLIINRLESLIEQTKAQNWLEFGCGNGNLTLPLAGRDRHVTAVEYDQFSLMGLARTLAKEPELKDRIDFISGDFQNKISANFSQVEGLLLNPPRSGVQGFLRPLSDCLEKPGDLIYMSCFLESFCEDGLGIQKLCYKLAHVEIIDQFPETPHFEILSLWSLGSLD